MKSLSSEVQGSLYAISSGLLYSLVGYFGLSLMRSMSISNMQFWRFLISTVCILIFCLVFRQKNHDKPLDKLKALLTGAFFYCTCAGIYFEASTYIGTGLAMVMFFTYPIYVLLLNRLIFKTSVPKIYYFSIVMIVLGMLQLIDLSDLTLELTGIGLAILSAVIYALYIVCSKKIQVSATESTLMVSLGCAIACLLFSIGTNTFMVPSIAYEWFYIFGIGIICTAVPMLLFLKGLHKISSEKASLLSVTEPVFVIFFGVLLLGETLSLIQISGILTVIFGAFLTMSNRLLPNFIPETLSQRV